MARRIFGSRRETGQAPPGPLPVGGPVADYPSNLFATKADANAWPANQQADTGRGVLGEPSSGKAPFGHYALNWLHTRRDIEATTRAKCEGLLRAVLPAFGSHRTAYTDPGGVRGRYHALAAKYPTNHRG